MIYKNNIYLPQLTTFTTGIESFADTESLSLDSNSLLLYSFDFPQLTTITVGKSSFIEARSLSLTSNNNIVQFI